MKDQAEGPGAYSPERLQALTKRVEDAEALREQRKDISAIGLSARDVSELQGAEKLVRDAKSKSSLRSLAKRISTLLEDDRQK